MSFTSQPGWPEMKYGTRYCSLPESTEYFSNSSLKRTNISLAGFFITFTTPGEMLRRDLEVSADMVRHQLTDVLVAVLLVRERHVVADAARHERALHAGQLTRLAHQLDERPVVGAELLADRRVHAGSAAAARVPRLVGTHHVPHVRGGAADVADHSGPARDVFQALDLAQHRRLAARDHVAALVLGDAAEAAPGGAAAHDGDAEADLLPGGDLRLAIHRVRQAREGQLVLFVDQSGGGRRRWRIHVDQIASMLLDEDARVVRVVLEMVEARELR